MVLDSTEFNARLFHPRRDATRPPAGAIDSFVGDWHVRRHPGPGPALLLFHGNGEVVADYDGLAPRFAEAGVSLVVADFPGYGLARGTPTLRRLIEEAPAIADAVKPDAVMGRSLGSACANALIGLGAPGRWILESGFVDVRALIARRGLPVPARLSDEETAVFDPLPKLARAQGRLLVLHGANDTLIVPDEARRAFAAATAPDKQLVLIPGAGHNDLSFADAYWDAVAALMR